MSLVVPLSAHLVLMTVDSGVSPSSDDYPFLLPLDNSVSHLASPNLSVVGLDSKLLLDDLDLGSGSVGGLDDNLNWNADYSGLLPSSGGAVVVGLGDLDSLLSDDESVGGELSDWSVAGLDDELLASVASVNSLDVVVLVGDNVSSLTSLDLIGSNVLASLMSGLADISLVVDSSFDDGLLYASVVLDNQLVMAMGNMGLVVNSVVGVSDYLSLHLFIGVARVARVARAGARARAGVTRPRSRLPST